MNIESIKTAYRRYAGIYDVVFGPVFHPGRKLIVQALDCRPRERILEVGVGTGLSLPLYPRDVSVTGIDISGDMLTIARERVAESALTQVEQVLEMDAEDMTFSDSSFDKVVAMYVVSVVPDPGRLVAEMCRVCKAGGDIVIVSHFRSRNRLLAATENLLSPLAKLAGFRPNLDLDRFLKASRLDVVRMDRTNFLGYWKVLHCRNSGKAAVAQARAA